MHATVKNGEYRYGCQEKGDLRYQQRYMGFTHRGPPAAKRESRKRWGRAER
jgi:hypothetical protein